MKRTAIVGIGSPLGDDRAGWIVIEALDAALTARERAEAGVTTVALDRPGVALLEHVRGMERAVLVDALRGDAAGKLVLLRADDLQRDAARTSTHDIGVAEALTLGATLKLLPPQSILIGITIDPSAADAVVSASVRRAAGRLARSLAHWLRASGDAWPPLLPDPTHPPVD